MKKTSPIIVFAIIVTLIMLALRFTPIPVAPQPDEGTASQRAPSSPTTTLPDPEGAAPARP